MKVLNAALLLGSALFSPSAQAFIADCFHGPLPPGRVGPDPTQNVSLVNFNVFVNYVVFDGQMNGHCAAEVVHHVVLDVVAPLALFWLEW